MKFKTGVAYHSSGEILYWDSEATGRIKNISRKIADMIIDKTGYMIINNPVNYGGHFTDWFLTSKKPTELYT